MNDSITLQIIDEAIDQLNEDRPTGIPEATDKRVIPPEAIKGLHMAVYLGNETVDPPIGSSNIDPISRRRTTIAVQCAAGTDDVAALDRIVDPLLCWATAVLGQTKLDGLAHYVRESGTQRQVYYQDLYVMIATRVFEVSYQTRRNDLRKT